MGVGGHDLAAQAGQQRVQRPLAAVGHRDTGPAASGRPARARVRSRPATCDARNVPLNESGATRTGRSASVGISRHVPDLRYVSSFERWPALRFPHRSRRRTRTRSLRCSRPWQCLRRSGAWSCSRVSRPGPIDSTSCSARSTVYRGACSAPPCASSSVTASSSAMSTRGCPPAWSTSCRRPASICSIALVPLAGWGLEHQSEVSDAREKFDRLQKLALRGRGDQGSLAGLASHRVRRV